MIKVLSYNSAENFTEASSEMVNEMNTLERYQDTLEEIREAGLYKIERVITTPQSVEIKVQDGSEVLNFCANNYLGLADNPEVIAAAHKALDDHGFGLASVRFICGTQDLHKQLEQTISGFFGTDDTILYTSCFDANGGLFETILGPEDAVISDALNHASIIDGIRLCKAQRHRYPNSDMVCAGRNPQIDAGLPQPPDRDRRGLQHGRLHRETG